jgi:glycosyltransferase involved in cell wall biosynthesis
LGNKYVLITPARNEEDYIGATIESVLRQTLKPTKWLIISDGSTDRTDDIVSHYAAKYNFIELMRKDPKEERNFSSKVNAINNGFKYLEPLSFEYFGNLDADISLESDYYEKILNKFRQNSRLGIAGGIIFDVVRGIPQKPFGSLDNVGCAIQMFRRKCFVEIGGYQPLEKVGEDTIAEVAARMHAWDIGVFPELKVQHHRRMGTGQDSLLKSRFRYGIQEYCYGSHPLFVLVKSIFRFSERPFIIGGILRYFGYLWGVISRHKQQVSKEIVGALRKEQLQKLTERFFKNKVEISNSKILNTNIKI